MFEIGFFVVEISLIGLIVFGVDVVACFVAPCITILLQLELELEVMYDNLPAGGTALHNNQ